MRQRSLYIILFSLILLVGCGTKTNEEGSLSSPYIVALEQLMVEDDALNHEMDFIAIDMSNFGDLSNEEKAEISDYFGEKYDIDVKIATFEQLKEQGHFNEETMTLDGVLLSFESVELKGSDKAIFEGTKYRSGLGAIGLEIIVEKHEEDWQVKESKMLWIS